MSVRGPAWEGGPGDPPAGMDYDPQTAPLPPSDLYADHDSPGDGWSPPRGRRPGRGRRLLRRLGAVLLALVVLAGVIFGLLYLVTPSVQDAPARARAFDQAHHVAYPGPPVPALFAESLVATEDHRFYSEPGIDLFAVARVAAATVTGHGAAQGGATLYQQLAKMLYTPGASGVSTEVEQVMLGIKLDLAFSKPQILRMYSDVAYFGHGYYGLAEASCGWPGWCRPRRWTTPSCTTPGAAPARRTCWPGWSPPARSPPRNRLRFTPRAWIWSVAAGGPARPSHSCQDENHPAQRYRVAPGLVMSRVSRRGSGSAW
jgi:Transglycosylase